MEEDKIVLDRKSFEALAVDTRVKILKSLKERRKTLSEIAREQGMSVSGVKEHLETLEKVGLIEKMDDGHKWKYYELTKKGGDIVAPRELRVWILLSISTIALFASVLAILSAPGLPQDSLNGSGLAMAEAEPQLKAAAAAYGIGENFSDGAATEGGDLLRTNEAAPPEADSALSAIDIEESDEATQKPDMTLPFAVLAISGLTLVACIGILVRNRFKPASL
ncbi:MAG: winged helix-turn-helix domain-containing protein [Candidatus Micrarchaeota archaeon]